MSSRSNGVTKVRLSRSTTSCVSRSPVCSWLLIWLDQLGAVVREAIEEVAQEPRDVDGVRGRPGEQLVELATLRSEREADPLRAASYQLWRGTGTRMCSPSPGRSRASTVPPAAVTTCFTIASPRPVPRDGARPVGPEEALEEAGQVLLADADAVVVGSEDDRRRPRCAAERHVEPSPRSGSRSRRGSDDDSAACAGAAAGRTTRSSRSRSRRRPAPRSARGRRPPARAPGERGSSPARRRRGRFELAEEQHVVDELADPVDLPRASSMSAVRSAPGSIADSSRASEPRERRPQLVRDRRREPRPQLLVGGEVARTAQVEKGLAYGRSPRRRPRAACGRRPAQGSPGTAALDDSFQRLAGAPARRDHAALSSRTTTTSRLSSTSADPRAASTPKVHQLVRMLPRTRPKTSHELYSPRSPARRTPDYGTRRCPAC